MDPVLCCVLGICCPPFSPEQRETLENILTLELRDADAAKKIVDMVFDDFAKVTARLKALVAETRHGRRE